MLKPTPIFSQRFLRKGPLVEETYRLFSEWNDRASVVENLDRGFRNHFPTLAWEREVRATTSARLKSLEGLRPLIVLGRSGMNLNDWRDCWRLWIGASEEPFGGFVRNWLFPERQAGRRQLRAADLREYTIAAWNRHSPKRALSEHGVVRAGRDLLHTAAQLAMLAGDGPVKTFAPMSMSDDVALFYAHLIADLEGSTAKVPGSHFWRMTMLPASEIHVLLLRLHQFRLLDYQVAGTLIQLTLPHSSALAFAETLSL